MEEEVAVDAGEHNETSHIQSGSSHINGHYNFINFMFIKSNSISEAG